jgi:hypothetical protein
VRRSRSKLSAAVAVAALLSAAACGGGSATTTSPAATPVAAPTATIVFTDTVPVGGSKFYSFVVGVNGTVNLTLVSVTGDNVSSNVSLGLDLGTPSGTSCSSGTSANAQAGVNAPQVTQTEAPGRYCAMVTDIGNLLAPATFTVNIDHP